MDAPYPFEPHEIDHFVDMLKLSTKQMSPDQIETLAKELRVAADRIKAEH